MLLPLELIVLLLSDFCCKVHLSTMSQFFFIHGFTMVFRVSCVILDSPDYLTGNYFKCLSCAVSCCKVARRVAAAVCL